MTAPLPQLRPSRRRVLADEVTDSLRQAIVSGNIEPGRPLFEEELASKLNVSRGPVREALVRLHQEGLVVLETHRTARVASLSREDASQIYSLRRVLEQLSVEWACNNATDADFDAMDAVLDEFAKTPKNRRTPAFTASLDIKFHDAMFLAAHHERLYRSWEGLRSQIYSFLLTRMALRPDYQLSWEPDHRELLELVRTKSPDAVQMISDHVEGAYRRMLAGMSDQEW